MPPRNALRQFRKTLYHLKRDYGDTADIYHIAGRTQDMTTGKVIDVRIKYHIRRAIVIPIGLLTAILGNRTPKQDQTFPVQGYDMSQRYILFDNRDLEKINAVLKKEDYIVVNHQRYDISSIEELEDGISTLIGARWIHGREPHEIYDLTIKQKIKFQQTIGGTLIR